MGEDRGRGHPVTGLMANPSWLGVALAVLVTLGGCSGSDHSADGYRRGAFERTVNVWVDDDGPFTCPPEGPIATSDPPQCAAQTGDRVRLRGEAIESFVADSGRADAEHDEDAWVGSAKITGRSVDGGFTIETETVDGG